MTRSRRISDIEYMKMLRHHRIEPATKDSSDSDVVCLDDEIEGPEFLRDNAVLRTGLLVKDALKP